MKYQGRGKILPPLGTQKNPWWSFPQEFSFHIKSFRWIFTSDSIENIDMILYVLYSRWKRDFFGEFYDDIIFTVLSVKPFSTFLISTVIHIYVAHQPANCKIPMKADALGLIAYLYSTRRVFNYNYLIIVHPPIIDLYWLRVVTTTSLVG